VSSLLLAGTVRVPLPAPAHNKYVNLVPQGVLPWQPHPLKVGQLLQTIGRLAGLAVMGRRSGAWQS
jgi:hypothetical protein